MRPRRLYAETNEEGFTLVEVIVALTLLGIIATAALTFFVKSYAQAATIQRHQQAVALTNAALEQARSASATIPATGGYGLATGRSLAQVTAQWAASSAPDLALTYPSWDPSPSGPPTVPFSIGQTIAGQTYQTAVFVGTCYQVVGSTGTATCGRIGASAVPPTPIPAGYSPLVRIIAETTWTPPTHSGCATVCTYRVSSLVDPATDPQWATGSGEAVNDVTAVTHGASVTIPVLANDSVVAAAGTAVQIVSAPPSGQGTAVVQSNNTITYSAPSTLAAGTKVAFTYNVLTTAGTRSNTAAVQVTIS